MLQVRKWNQTGKVFRCTLSGFNDATVAFIKGLKIPEYTFQLYNYKDAILDLVQSIKTLM